MAGTEIHIRDVMTSNIRNICSIFSFHSTSFGKRDFKNRGGKEGGSTKYKVLTDKIPYVSIFRLDNQYRH